MLLFLVSRSRAGRHNDYLDLFVWADTPAAALVLWRLYWGDAFGDDGDPLPALVRVHRVPHVPPRES